MNYLSSLDETYS